MIDGNSETRVHPCARHTSDGDYQAAQRLRRETRLVADHALVSELCAHEIERTTDDVDFLESLARRVEDAEKPLTPRQRERASALFLQR